MKISKKQLKKLIQEAVSESKTQLNEALVWCYGKARNGGCYKTETRPAGLSTCKGRSDSWGGKACDDAECKDCGASRRRPGLDADRTRSGEEIPPISPTDPGIPDDSINIGESFLKEFRSKKKILNEDINNPCEDIPGQPCIGPADCKRDEETCAPVPKTKGCKRCKPIGGKSISKKSSLNERVVCCVNCSDGIAWIYDNAPDDRVNEIRNGFVANNADCQCCCADGGHSWACGGQGTMGKFVPGLTPTGPTTSEPTAYNDMDMMG